MKLFLAFCLIGTAAAAGRDECPMTCTLSPENLVQVEHDASSSHTQHRCFVSDEDVCECECRESDSHSWIHQDLTAQHCAGGWTNSECEPACDATCKDTETFSFTTQPNAIGNACDFSDGQTRDGTERTGMTSQNCVGSWSTTTTCTPECGETCYDTETFTVSQEANSCGTACSDADGATRNGQQHTGAACPVCDSSLDLAIASNANSMSKSGGSKCEYLSGDRLKMAKGNRECIWESDWQNLGAGHNYEKLRVEFDVREKHWQENSDHATVYLQACPTANSGNPGCTTMKALHRKRDDIDKYTSGWSSWKIDILSNGKNVNGNGRLSILANHQYVRLKVALKSDHKKEEWMVRNLQIKSEC